MARFDVYRNTGPHEATTPYLLDVQCNLLDGLESRVVIPLRLLDRVPPVKLPERLTPIVNVNGQKCLLETPKMAALPRRLLKDCIASLASEQALIIGALDFLFQGY